MNLEVLFLFVPACFALNMAPGPNNLLSVANGTRYGFSAACIAGIGRLTAFIGMIAISATGLSVVLQASETLFFIIKFAGALYLFYLAMQLWRAPSVQPNVAVSPGRSLLAPTKQEFLVAVGNPKAILIFTVLGGLFLVLEWLAIAAYAYLGRHLRRWFASPKRRQVFNRVCGSLLGAAGIGLLAARRSTNAA